MDLHGDALKRIMGDMDDMESGRMFPKPVAGEGATITISVMPGQAGTDEGPEEGADEEMNKGGCAMAEGGMVQPPMPQEDMGMPPFLRKKKGI